MKSSNSIILILKIVTTVYASGEDKSHKRNNMLYNDGELVILNDSIIDAESSGIWNEDITLNKFIPPISTSEVKCIMQVDRHCSTGMAHIKGLLISALKDGCENCTVKEKESVGKIIASMWAHDAQLWKLFLKRFDSTGSLKNII